MGFGMPGWMEIAIIALIVLLLFGNRLPSVMRSLGSSIVEFKKGVREGDEDDGDNEKIDQQPTHSEQS